MLLIVLMGLSFLLKLEKYGSKDRNAAVLVKFLWLLQFDHSAAALLSFRSYVYPHDLAYNYCLPFGLKFETYCIILHGQALFSIKAATEITLVGLKHIYG